MSVCQLVDCCDDSIEKDSYHGSINYKYVDSNISYKLSMLFHGYLRISFITHSGAQTFQWILLNFVKDFSTLMVMIK